MTNILQFTKAVAFAAERHAGQRRKGEAAEPYINHLAEVAHLVAEATGGRDASLVAAAFLHDALEDTQTTYDELSVNFGEDVAALVQEVTDDKSLPKEERKRLQIEHAPTRSNRAKLIKLADKISNLRAIAASPPEGWSQERKEDYVTWAEAVVRGLGGVNRHLDTEFKTAVAEARASLKARRSGY